MFTADLRPVIHCAVFRKNVLVIYNIQAFTISQGNPVAPKKLSCFHYLIEALPKRGLQYHECNSLMNAYVSTLPSRSKTNPKINEQAII